MSTRQVQARGVVERRPDGATVTFERHFASPPEDVWRALTESPALAGWLAEADVDLRLGGRIEVRFGDGTMIGRITELVAGSVLAYSWHEGGPAQSHVRWELAARDGGTALRLVHTRLAPESASGFAAGWHHHLERLEALVNDSPIDWSWTRFAELGAAYGAESTASQDPTVHPG